MRAARFAFALLASGWIVLLLAAPAAALGAPASGLVYAFGSVICHQRPERSFHVAGAQLPVCARCFGIYAGAALGVLAALKPGLTPPQWRSSSPVDVARGVLSDSRRAGLRTLLIAAAIPTVITWAAEVSGFWSSANLTRFVAAVPLGAAVALTVNYVECAQPRRTGPSPPRIPI